MSEINENKNLDVTTDNEEIKISKPKKKSALKEVMDWISSIVVAVVIVAVINMFVFVQVVVDGSSMYPTLKDRDRLFAWRLGYTPAVSDIVVIEPYLKEGSVKGKLMLGKTLYIKRVVAVAGQTVDLKDGKVYIDGVQKDEPYIADDVNTFAMSTPLPCTVPEGCVFVMGDNREHSKDSRDASVGIVRNEQVVGKAKLRIFPFNVFGFVE